METEEGKQQHHEHLTVDDQAPPPGCGILGRYPVVSVLAFAIVGIGIGVGLSFWDPDDSDEAEKKYITLKWLGLIGDLFIRL
jgi:hypothetical protein